MPIGARMRVLVACGLVIFARVLAILVAATGSAEAVGIGMRTGHDQRSC
ncbi:MAG: hypothetical protein JO212_16920 [Acetobacteraceae bacterium]|nr:hypothetical protein [Acetobacteraceae bacterium]MBV8591709.1 hypothetical protein [Acetobacteraceae bacterium]